MNPFALLKKISTLNIEKQELEKSVQFLEIQTTILNNKVFNSDKQIKELEKIKEDFLIEKSSFQYLREKKKKKIKGLQTERKELLAKLEGVLDKELTIKNQITKQSMELELLKLEKKNLNQNIQILSTEKMELKATIKTLEAEIEILRTKNRSTSPENTSKTYKPSDSRIKKKSETKNLFINNDSKEKKKSESLYAEFRAVVTTFNSEEEKGDRDNYDKINIKNERAISSLQKNRKIQKISSFIKHENQKDSLKTAPNFLCNNDFFGEGKEQAESSPFINKEKLNLVKKNSNSKKEQSDQTKKNERDIIDEKISDSSKVIPTRKIIEKKSLASTTIEYQIEGFDLNEREKKKFLKFLTDLSHNPNRMKLLNKFSNILLKNEKDEPLNKQNSVEIKNPHPNLMKHSISTTNSTQINCGKNEDHYLNELTKVKKSFENSSQREKKSTSISSTERMNSDIAVLHKSQLVKKDQTLEKNMLSLNSDIHSELNENHPTDSKNKETLHRYLKSENGKRKNLFKSIETQRTNKNSYLTTEYFLDKKKSVPVLSIEKNIFENLDLDDLIPENHLESISEEENFSKLKYLYQYPFRSITTQLKKKNNTKNLGLQRNNYQDDFDSFASVFKNLLKNHEKCSFPCEHLKRFYKRVKFVSKYLSKEELILQKNVIDKLPELLSTEYF